MDWVVKDASCYLRNGQLPPFFFTVIYFKGEVLGFFFFIYP